MTRRKHRGQVGTVLADTLGRDLRSGSARRTQQQRVTTPPLYSVRRVP